MPSIIDYPTVLETLERSGLRCVYPNSGAFALPPAGDRHIAGWCAANDATIRPEVRVAVRIVAPPASGSLATLLRRAWEEHLTGPLWLMPASHWAFELQFGGVDWLPKLLADHGIDSEVLRNLSDGSALEFQADEAVALSAITKSLFDRMIASDFTAAFPTRPVVAMLHHHQQIWWQTSDRRIWGAIDSLT